MHVVNLRWKTWAFFKRDLITETSYRFHFVIELINSVLPILLFYFLGQMIGKQALADTSWADADYFAFVVIGLGFTRYFQFALSSFSTSIRNSQATGCLEAMFATQTSPLTILLLSSIYSLTTSLTHLAALLICSSFLGFCLSGIHLPAALLAFLLSVTAYLGFGILSATFTILFKRGDPITWFITVAGAFVGGAYFPVDLLPAWLQAISRLVPITHSLEALRATLLENAGIAQVAPQLLTLTLISVVLLPASLYAYSKAVDHCRRLGTLGHY